MRAGRCYEPLGRKQEDFTWEQTDKAAALKVGGRELAEVK